MTRVFVRSNVLGALMGLYLFICARVIIALFPPPLFGESALFWTFELIGWIVICPAFLVSGLLGLPTETRLRTDFGILVNSSSCYPRSQRTVKIQAEPNEFLRRIALLLTHSFSLVDFSESPSCGDGLSCRVRHGVSISYDVCVRLDPGDRTGMLIVQNRSSITRLPFAARLLPTDVTALRILAGVITWAADRNLIGRDFRLSCPERLESDLRGLISTKPAPWEMERAAGDVGEIVATERALQRQRLQTYRLRMAGLLVVCLTILLTLILLGRNGVQIPQKIQLLLWVPILVYWNVQIARLYAKPKPPQADGDMRR